MHKRMFALALAVLVLFSLAACGGGAGSQPEGGAPAGQDETASAELGFREAADAQAFVDAFNSESDGYAYLVESDAVLMDGTSLREQGYSVCRILIWDDKSVESQKDALGDLEGWDPHNNLNVRLIYNAEGRLALFKTLFTISNSEKVAKADNAASCDAMLRVLSALFPGNTEEQTRALYEALRLPTLEEIESFQPKSDYESKTEVVEHFLAHCGYEVDPEGLLGAYLEYDCGGLPYRLICQPYAESAGDLFAIYWDIALATPEDIVTYEAAMTILA